MPTTSKFCAVLISLGFRRPKHAVKNDRKHNARSQEITQPDAIEMTTQLKTVTNNQRLLVLDCIVQLNH
jgi:hypothetical protein